MNEIEMIQGGSSFVASAYAVSGGLLLLLIIICLQGHHAAKRRLARLEAEASHDR